MGLKVMTKLNRRLEKDTRIMELCQNESDVLRDLNTYIPNLMNRLWEQPKLVVSVIQHAQITDLKNHLAPFFANNFYENILSSYYIEDNLMYVFYFYFFSSFFLHPFLQIRLLIHSSFSDFFLLIPFFLNKKIFYKVFYI